MMDRRRKLAKIKEMFFNQTLTEDEHDEEEVEHIPEEVVSSMLLDLVEKVILLHPENIRQEVINEDDKNEQNDQLTQVSIETIELLPEAQKRMMERRRKLAKIREMFFNHSLTEDAHDEEEVEHLANEVVSSVLLDLVNESILPHQANTGQEESKEDYKYEQKAQPIEVSKDILHETIDSLPPTPVDILPQISETMASRLKFNELRRRFRGLLKRLLPCVH